MRRTRPSGPPARRARLRPTLDSLERRDLMAFAGGLDPTLGVGGYVSAISNPDANTGLTSISTVAVQADGSIYEAGVAGVAGQTTFAIVHLSPTGVVDTSFGGGGEADIVLPAGATARAGNTGAPAPVTLLVQPNFAIDLVAPFVPAGSSTADDTVIVRLGTNGLLDPTFGTNGRVILGPAGTPIGGATFRVAALQADGRILLAGTGPNPLSTNQSTAVALARLTTNGQVDATYGTNGLATVSGASMTAITTPILVASEVADALAIQADGRAVVSATYTQGIVNTGQTQLLPAEIFRVNTNGTPDTSLTPTGLQTANVTQPGLDGLAVQANGQIVLNGTITTNSMSGPVTTQRVVRLNGNGTLDAAISVPSTELPGGISALAVQANGAILLAGPGPQASPSTPKGTTAVVFRLKPDLTPDFTFGSGAVATLSLPVAPPAPGSTNQFYPANTIAITGAGQFIVAGSVDSTATGQGAVPRANVVARLLVAGTSAHEGDFTGDGISDPAIYLPAYGNFAIQDSSGKTAGKVVPFGSAGKGNSIPAPGNYYATGQQDIAVYLPSAGAFAIQDPTGQTAGKVVPFGSAGFGNTIPAPGDYYGTGQDDIAIYLPNAGVFAIQDPTGRTAGKVVPFGSAGTGQSIPVPGDYYGTGQDDIAVYLASAGGFAIQDPTGKTAGEFIPFGSPGIGNSIPMPGDYDGSGKTEVAVYIPSQGAFYYRPANGGPDVKISFGAAGPGQTLPMQGDYTGSGHTELGIYLPSYGVFAYQPPTGVGPSEQYGVAGPGQTIPVTKVVLSPFPGTPSGGTRSVVTIRSVLGEPDLLDFLPPEVVKKPKA